ncbi:MAG: TetR/AcrR family transcriptional regulator [Fulvivirga sp.]
MENISDKKRAIFESMLELIKDHGFHGAPMSLVSKNAGVAAGTIYHYFASKDKLICELHAYNRSRVVEIINAALDTDKPFKAKLFNIWMSLYEFYIENPNVLIFFEQYINSPFNMNKCPNHFEGRFFRFLKEGIETRQLKATKPEMLMVLTMGNISSIAKMSSFGHVPFNEADLKQVREMLWDAIAAKSNAG